MIIDCIADFWGILLKLNLLSSFLKRSGTRHYTIDLVGSFVEIVSIRERSDFLVVGVIE